MAACFSPAVQSGPLLATSHSYYDTAANSLGPPYIFFFFFPLAMALPLAVGFLEIAGYWGVIPTSLFPAITPAETAIFLGAAALTAAMGLDGL